MAATAFSRSGKPITRPETRPVRSSPDSRHQRVCERPRELGRELPPSAAATRTGGLAAAAVCLNSNRPDSPAASISSATALTCSKRVALAGASAADSSRASSTLATLAHCILPVAALEVPSQSISARPISRSVRSPSESTTAASSEAADRVSEVAHSSPRTSDRLTAHISTAPAVRQRQARGEHMQLPAPRNEPVVQGRAGMLLLRESATLGRRITDKC